MAVIGDGLIREHEAGAVVGIAERLTVLTKHVRRHSVILAHCPAGRYGGNADVHIGIAARCR